LGKRIAKVPQKIGANEQKKMKKKKNEKKCGE